MTPRIDHPDLVHRCKTALFSAFVPELDEEPSASKSNFRPAQGYPIKLVCARQHLFCRWHDIDRGVRLNIEGAGDGFAVHPDDHYRKWPKPIKDRDEERAFGFLASFTPKRELANFVAQRAYALADHRRYAEAFETFAVCNRLEPDNASHAKCTLDTLELWKRHLQSLYPPRFPRRVEILIRPDQARWPAIPWPVEREFAALRATELCLMEPYNVQMLWDPLRKGLAPLAEIPESFTVDYTRKTSGTY